MNKIRPTRTVTLLRGVFDDAVHQQLQERNQERLKKVVEHMGERHVLHPANSPCKNLNDKRTV